jgi:hypothetical protein
MADRVYSEASHVEAVEGRVTVEGPDGVDVALTPDAAMKPPIACLSQRPKRRAPAASVRALLKLQPST